VVVSRSGQAPNIFWYSAYLAATMRGFAFFFSTRTLSNQFSRRCLIFTFLGGGWVPRHWGPFVLGLPYFSSYLGPKVTFLFCKQIIFGYVVFRKVYTRIIAAITQFALSLCSRLDSSVFIHMKFGNRTVLRAFALIFVIFLNSLQPFCILCRFWYIGR